MNKLLFVICFVAAASLSASAQSTTERFPFHTISKPVQQLAYKNVEFVPAKITTGDPAPVISKGVHLTSLRRSSKKTAILKTNGTPAWVISKGVARMQYERKN
jgi:hypothetical protein